MASLISEFSDAQLVAVQNLSNLHKDKISVLEQKNEK